MKSRYGGLLMILKVIELSVTGTDTYPSVPNVATKYTSFELPHPQNDIEKNSQTVLRKIYRKYLRRTSAAASFSKMQIHLRGQNTKNFNDFESGSTMEHKAAKNQSLEFVCQISVGT